MIDDETTLRGVDLVRSFGDGEGRAVALRSVSIELRRGQFALMMGPSGSGKSTLLAILSGLLPPDEGDVWVRDDMGDRSLWKMTRREREDYRLRQIGFIFQGYNLFPALTARQQLEIVLRWGYGTSSSESRKRADEMLSLLGLGKKSHLLPGQLSGGEKQRVAIGRALIKNPRFCFADEPTSALDWAHGEQVVELLRTAAHERGATILTVSHDSRLLPFVDVSFHLEDGRLSRSDSELEMPKPSATPLRSVS
ncbi:ABC transporter ATP-binding protein [Tuwongella immobilis]|uniref:ABC transporter domain-containing protein n=1 Tax=Tuwongella immobilis TaxID=692036 RepID=A0A6C2YVH5_9BACT|nr:ABC transporter ATP-binding protein [Tuwongella immobilis]VIP05444.1 abc transporter atp-binding protein : ABC-type antimicrobial peptide transport system, ATPase component OS=Singulisphaera acidiphila (strain ATCC BAA-1392 / DSM 18658 / VKM B-2454 / MOB10) GN=Sinac_2085 PE=3 SV=1: ABC_tran [Tuwongella immobilis]VTS08244.1 abc transporter atp-binding protein : ABC-type antimicrobial peptide transport system, ATPase component OS=Singulisphaera acidiphila (strain ATCC BAA-1392 / DSM 18658 / VKM 